MCSFMASLDTWWRRGTCAHVSSLRQSLITANCCTDLKSCEQSLLGPHVELARDVFVVQQSFNNYSGRIAVNPWVGALTMVMQAHPT